MISTELFIDNRIFKQRNVDIGVVSLDRLPGAGDFPASWCAAPARRGTCVRAQPYECYEEMDFDIPVGRHGDNYDRQQVHLYGRDAPVRQNHEAVPSSLRPPSGQGWVLAKGTGRAALPARK